MPKPKTLPPGIIINHRYEILELVGRGTAGEVYRVKDLLPGRAEGMQSEPGLERPLALKLFAAPAADFSLRDEFRLLTRIKHPYIVEVYEFGRDRGRHYFTMEYIEGEDLFEASMGLPFERIYPLIAQVCQALQHLHSQGVLHLDLKPQNILVNKQKDAAKLADFGLGEETRKPGFSRAKGTPAYLAPETAKGLRPDPRTDLYSLGVVLYQVFTRRLPHAGKTISDTIRRHLLSAPEDSRKINPSIPDGLNAIILKLLSKEPYDRYSNANEVISAINDISRDKYNLPVIEAQGNYVLSGKYVGRQKELAELKETLTKKKCRFALITGEAGMGKTRLVKEFTVWAQLRDIPVFSGKCREKEEKPYEPFRQIFKAMNPKAEKSLFEENAGLPELPPEQEKIRFLDKATETIKKTAGKKSVVLCLEDLHWADEGTANLLRYLIRSIKETNIFIAGTIRKGYDDSFGLSGENECLRIDLQPLAGEDVKDLVTSMLYTIDVPKELTEEIRERTGGNPLFIEEVIKSWHREGSLPELIKNPEYLRAKPIPEKIEEALLERIGTLPDEAGRVLRVMAVFGRETSLESLTKIMEIPDASLAQIVGELRRQGIVVKENNDYELSHPLLREILYRQIPHEERKTFHQRIGQLLEGSYKNDPEKGVEQIAYHYLQCKNASKALSYALPAAERAKKQYANAQAIELYQQLLPLLEDEGDMETRTKIMENLGELLSLTGKYREAINYYDRIMQLGQEHIDPKRFSGICIKKAGNYEKLGEYPLARESLESGMKRININDYPEEMAGIYHGLGNLFMRTCNYKESVEACLKALKFLISLDKSKSVQALTRKLYLSLGINHHRFLGDLIKAGKYYKKSLALSVSEGDLIGQLQALSTLGLLYHSRGNYPKAIFYHQRSMKLSKMAGNLHGVASSLNNLGLACFDKDMYQNAMGYYQKSLALLEKMGERNDIARNLTNLGGVYEMMGDDNLASASYEKALEISESLGDRQVMIGNLINLGNMSMRQGKYTRSLEYCQKGIKMSEDMGGAITEKTECYINLGSLFILLGKEAEVVSLATIAMEAVDKTGSTWMKGAVYKILGQAAQRREEYEEAKDNFQKAGELYSQIGMRRGLADIYLLQADLFIRRKCFRQAEEVLNKAGKIIARLKIPELMAQYHHLSAKLKIKITPWALSDIKKDLDKAWRLAKNIPETMWEISFTLGKYHEKTGRLKEAVSCYRQSLEILKTLAENITDEELKRSYLSCKHRAEALQTMEEIHERIKGQKG